MDSYLADATAWFEWIADEVGEWTLKFEFPGGYFPAGLVWEPRNNNYVNYTESVYYRPASTPEQKLIVQEDIVYPWPESKIPEGYWERPIQAENREWWIIGGNYPWRGPATDPIWDVLYPNTNRYWSEQQQFTPWVQGPNSAHIVWKRQGADHGIIGGDMGSLTWPFSFSSGNYNPPSIVFQGRIYQTATKVSPDGPEDETYWQCIDIRTGELIWERPLYPGESEPDVIEYGTRAGSVAGAEDRPEAPSLLSISGGYLRKYNPFNGIMTLNRSIAPLTGSGGTYYRNGYVLGVQNLGGGNYRLINWTTFGTARNLVDRIVSNTTYARSSLPDCIDWSVGLGADVDGISVEGANVGVRIRGFNLLTGQQLWETTLDEPQFTGSAAIADHSKVAVLSAYGYYVAYDLATGNLAWKSEQTPYPWGVFAGYNVQSAYGLLYRGTYAAFYAFNWTDGSIAWKYVSPAVSAYESEMIGPDGETVYPFRAPGMVADGKVFVGNQRQTPGYPMIRGWSMHAINATTGEGIWEVMFTGSAYNSPLQTVVADGYLTLVATDGYSYCFGIGKSETTVTAPKVAVPKGTAITIKGTVLDQSLLNQGRHVYLRIQWIHKWSIYINRCQSTEFGVMKR